MKKILNLYILPLIPMILWGSLFPFIKIGYEAFSINQESVPDILVFAAMRFIVCGIIVSAIALVRRDSLSENKIKGIGSVLLMGLFFIVLHYAFTYIGLTMTDSSKTALLKQLGSLFYICLAFLFIKGESFSIFKIIGAVLGFGGIIAINFTGNGLTFAVGDILIILASVCSVVSTILSKNCVQKISPFWITGISQFFGGIALLIAGVVMKGSFPTFNLKAFFTFAYICTASIIAYVLFTYVQKNTTNSRLLIIKFAEPLFACIFGAILLGEDILKLQYLVAFVLICGGIYLGSVKKEEIENEGDSV